MGLRFTVTALALVGVAGACGPGPGAPVAATPEPAPVQPAEAAAPPESPAEPVSAAPSHPANRLPPADAELRARALLALDEGRIDAALAMLRDLVDRHPGNLAVVALLRAAEGALESRRAGARAGLENVTATSVPAPPWSYRLFEAVPGQPSSAPPRLLERARERNQVTDDDKWFDEVGLRLPVLGVPNPMRGREGELPSWIPPSYGRSRIVQAIAHRDHTLALYGPDFSGGEHIAVFDAAHDAIGLFELSAFRHAPKSKPEDEMFVDQRIGWGQVVDGVLYISSGHRTYAKSSGGQNAYITALDVRDGSILWRSEPLVSNAANFLVDGDWIISGYGFTAERDYLFVLDRRTGKTVSRTPVRSGPDYILARGRQLFVRTYDTNYEFELK